MSNVAVHGGLVYATELTGYLHCLNARTGIGGLLVGMIPAAALKVGLGVILIASAVGVFHVKRH
ncbi:hypothetical protein AYO44_03955 [Planctomycetaceae bacterium SCGC AG-212-F19]|nr:hypothetical protein AYO44_03955 [Planctomycetaceae bacterium SCGC AG-212-F19]